VALRLRLRYTRAWGPFGAGAMSGEDHLLHEILGTGHLLAASIVLAEGRPTPCVERSRRRSGTAAPPTTILAHTTLAWSADSMDHFRSPGGLGKGDSAQ